MNRDVGTIHNPEISDEINAILTSTKQTSRLVSDNRIKDVKCVFTLKYHDFFILSAGSSFIVQFFICY